MIFESGEAKKDILVPIVNDTSGAKVFFTIELSDVVGPGSLGPNGTATVHIDNVAGMKRDQHFFANSFVICKFFEFTL